MTSAINILTETLNSKKQEKRLWIAAKNSKLRSQMIPQCQRTIDEITDALWLLNRELDKKKVFDKLQF